MAPPKAGSNRFRMRRVADMFAFTLLTLCLITYCESIHSLDYSDLESLGIGCGPRDSCNSSASRRFIESTCECDRDCHFFGDCCIDAPSYDFITVHRIKGLFCLPQNSYGLGVYALGKCGTNWTGPPNIQRKCESVRDISDPYLASPVTDIENNITYRNSYCSICNSVNVTNLQSWNIKIDCDTLLGYPNITDDYVLENLVFKTTYPHRNKWGVFLFEEEINRNVFHPCRITYKIPSELEETARFCRANLVSTCPPNWRRDTVRQNCGSYMAAVTARSRGYKNPHCAICNNVSLEDVFCQSMVATRSKPPMSFTLLLDVNLNDGNRVGEIQRCPTGQKYDSFFKKCRKLVCALPGYRMVNDKCVPP